MPVLVPVGGGEHEWSAIELGAWLATVEGRPLRLAGVAGSPLDGRDASRLLATASLLVQQMTGAETEPVLVAAGADELSAASADERALLLGVPRRRRLGLLS